jgi:hypothetical protein
MANLFRDAARAAATSEVDLTTDYFAAVLTDRGYTEDANPFLLPEEELVLYQPDQLTQYRHDGPANRLAEIKAPIRRFRVKRKNHRIMLVEIKSK